jgi:hypothetical protein
MRLSVGSGPPGPVQTCNTSLEHYISVINRTRLARTGRDISPCSVGLAMTLPDDGFDADELELAMWIVGGLVLVACAAVAVALLY